MSEASDALKSCLTLWLIAGSAGAAIRESRPEKGTGYFLRPIGPAHESGLGPRRPSEFMNSV